MINNCTLKLFYVFFMLIGIHLCYADKLSFYFLYGSGIESVYFDTSNLEYEDYATDIDKHSSFSADSLVSPTDNKVTVQLDITHQGSTDIAKVFNVISGYLPAHDNSRVMELNVPESYAVAVDFWLMAPFNVNGHFLGYVTLAHNNHSNSIGANDWWITADSGKRYELGNAIALTLNDEMGNYYCLEQNGTNYQILVRSGLCNNVPSYPSDGGKQFTFLYGAGVTSMEYDNSYTAFPQLVYTSVTSTQLDIIVDGKFQGSKEVADSFNNTYSNNNRLGIGTELSKAPATDIDISGTLKINGESVAVDFALAHEHKSLHNWWVGTNNGGRYTPLMGNPSLDVHDSKGNNYCLIQNYTNFQLLVAKGKCDTQQIQEKTFEIHGGDGLDVRFLNQGNYDNKHNGVQYPLKVEDEFIDPDKHKNNYYHQENIDSTILVSEAEIATSFINKFNDLSQNIMRLKASDTYKPSSSFYWFQGQLVVDNVAIADDFTIALDSDAKTFWIGTNKGIRKGDKLQVGEYLILSDGPNSIKVKKANMPPTFKFLYGSGISKIEYIPTYNANPQLTESMTSFSTPSYLAITVEGTFKGLDWEADGFNNYYGLNNKSGLGGSINDTNADSTDLYFRGILEINGKATTTDFGLAREHKSHDWWIASNSGEKNLDKTNKFSLRDTDGNYYCLNPDGSNNYVVVISGVCDSFN